MGGRTAVRTSGVSQAPEGPSYTSPRSQALRPRLSLLLTSSNPQPESSRAPSAASQDPGSLTAALPPPPGPRIHLPPARGPSAATGGRCPRLRASPLDPLTSSRLELEDATTSLRSSAVARPKSTLGTGSGSARPRAPSLVFRVPVPGRVFQGSCGSSPLL